MDDEDVQDFRNLDNMASNDALNFFISQHLQIEASITRLIESHMIRPDLLKIDRLSFVQKVRVAAALGLVPADFTKPILLLNSIRNRFVHQLTAELLPSDGKDFFASLSENLKYRMVELCKERKVKYDPPPRQL